MLTTVAIAFAVFVVVTGVMQRRLIYFPTRVSPDLAEQLAARNGFVPWRAAQGEIIGWKLAANGAPIGSVLVTHGNAGSAMDRIYLAGPIHAALQLDVHVLEYPGYGARPGSPSMRSILEAAEAALAALPKELPVFLVGESLGAGAVAHLAKTQPERIGGLVLFAPYDDLAAVGQAAMPFLPVKLMLRDRFRPAEWLAGYRGPLKVVLAGADEVIPPRFGQRLFDSYGGPKELEVVPSAGHNEIAEQATRWWVEVFGFLRQAGAPPPESTQAVK
jgi:pimeloyl-ACP methyl ester carboxylesterase